MPYIYKISNDINEKQYIGKTLYTIERRWSQHIENARNRADLAHQPIYAAMNKHGIEHFSISVLEHIVDEKQLSAREQYWIKFYDTYKHGYNATIGGDGAQLYDYDYIWEQWQSGNTIKQISAKIPCNDYVVRTVLDIHGVSTEDRKSRSFYRQEAVHSRHRRPVKQIDTNTNKIVRTYSSVTEASEAVHVDSSCLSKACKLGRTACGYRWAYDDNQYVQKDFTAKKVCKIDLSTGEVLDVFPSISAAARSVDGDSSYISKVCKGLQKSSKGFGWAFIE